MKAARYVAGKGVRRFSLVTSGRALREIDEVVDLYKAIHAACPELYLCASLGLLSREDLQKLYDAGVRRYHCNLETAPSFFGQLCTTHTTEEKIRVLRDAVEVGMEVCSGGIIGMGETREQRVELAETLRDLGVRSIPVNILCPIEGTPLADMPPLSDDDVLDTVATFRALNSEARIRLAGGRARIKHLERRLLHSGIDALIVGDMLTTAGSSIDDDFKMIKDEGYEL